MTCKHGDKPLSEGYLCSNCISGKKNSYKKGWEKKISDAKCIINMGFENKDLIEANPFLTVDEYKNRMEGLGREKPEEYIDA